MDVVRVTDEFWDDDKPEPGPGMPTIPSVSIKPYGPKLHVEWRFYDGLEPKTASTDLPRGTGVTGRLRTLLRDIVGRKDYERVVQHALSEL